MLTSLDLFDDGRCALGTNIVHDDVTTELSEHESIDASQTGTGASNDDSLAIKPNRRV